MKENTEPITTAIDIVELRQEREGAIQQIRRVEGIIMFLDSKIEQLEKRALEAQNPSAQSPEKEVKS